MATVDFYFDCSCPWTYLAFTRLRETATRTGAVINFKPILVDRVRRLVNPQGSSSRIDPNATKAAYREKDLQDWARFCAITITLPAKWPADTEPGMAGAVLAAELGYAIPYVKGVFEAYFKNGTDVSDAQVLIEIAVSAGLDEDLFARGIADEATLAVVQTHCTELIERGGFGSPTMFVGDDMYFGNDRMPLVEFAIGQSSDRQFVMPGQHGA
jgi:2-hydroxychromene-2-carboxylate isomerase